MYNMCDKVCFSCQDVVREKQREITERKYNYPVCWICHVSLGDMDEQTRDDLKIVTGKKKCFLVCASCQAAIVANGNV